MEGGRGWPWLDPIPSSVDGGGRSANRTGGPEGFTEVAAELEGLEGGGSGPRRDAIPSSPSPRLLVFVLGMLLFLLLFLVAVDRGPVGGGGEPERPDWYPEVTGIGLKRPGGTIAEPRGTFGKPGGGLIGIGVDLLPH